MARIHIHIQIADQMNTCSIHSTIVSFNNKTKGQSTWESWEEVKKIDKNNFFFERNIKRNQWK